MPAPLLGFSTSVHVTMKPLRFKSAVETVNNLKSHFNSLGVFVFCIGFV